MTQSERSVSSSFNELGSNKRIPSLDDTLRSLRLVLEQLVATTKSSEVDPRRHFYKIFNREADEYDRDFHKKYHDDLNTTLIFAGLFSAVASAFIIDIQQELRPDYNEMSFTALTMLLNATSGIPNQSGIPVAPGPKASAVQVQSILFGSLMSALLAAFLAMLGKQWLNLHVEGSLIDRSRHRELKMRGMITWRFKMIMECLPFVMQVSLLLLGYALARYLWDLSRTVSTVIATFTVFGLLFYLSIVFAATVWKTCPFQTPVSVVLRHIVSLARKSQHRWLRKRRGQLSGMVNFRKLNESFVTATEELTLEPHAPHDVLTLALTVVDLEEDEGTHTSDTNCISTMFRFASGSEAIVAVTGFIPEVNWTLNVRRVPLLEVCHSLRRSFELLKDGRASVRHGMREQAYSSASALLYLCVQRLCVGATDTTHIVATSLQPLLLGYQSKKDHELASTLQILDAVSNPGSKDIPWGEFAFSDSHYCRLSHIIRCRAWISLKTKEPLAKDVSGFVLHSFSKDSLPPRVFADCLLIVNMIVGNLPELDEGMLIKDKSPEIEDIIRQVYRSIEASLAPGSSITERQRAIAALEFMAPMKQEMLCVESYKIFRMVMGTVELYKWLWGPAELLMFGAFKWHMEPPSTGDPAELVRFLRHSLLERESGLVRDEPIERIMLALAGATADELGGGLEKVDFTEPLFFDGICRALGKEAPYRLRRATVAFLRHLDAQFFDPNKMFSEEQATTLVSGWSVSARESWDKNLNPVLAEALVTTLMGLLHSPFWREHIPAERWDILRIIGSLGGSLPRSLYRCFGDPTIIPYLRVRHCDSGAFTQWVAILWMKYPDLSEEVKAQLMEATEEIAGWPRNDISTYLTILDGEIERDEKRIDVQKSWSFEEEAVRLRARHDTLLSARNMLALVGSPFS